MGRSHDDGDMDTKADTGAGNGDISGQKVAL